MRGGEKKRGNEKNNLGLTLHGNGRRKTAPREALMKQRKQEWRLIKKLASFFPYSSWSLCTVIAPNQNCAQRRQNSIDWNHSSHLPNCSHPSLGIAFKNRFVMPQLLTRSSPARLLSAKMFNRNVKAIQRNLVDASKCSLHSRVAAQMLERRNFVKKDTPVVLEVGAHTGWYLRHMLEQRCFRGLKQYIQCDISEERLNRNYADVKSLLPPGMEFVQLCCDEEAVEAFDLPERSVDLVVSCLSMHWVNDLELAIQNIRNVMKKDAFFLMSMFGGNTLCELRSAFALSETERDGGLSPHVSAMIDGTGLSMLMTQAGFSLPSIDIDRFIFLYPSAFHLMEHLQDMGESAAIHVRRPFMPRDLLLGMSALYDSMFMKDGLVPATFEIFHSMVWSPVPKASPLDKPKAVSSPPKPIHLGDASSPLHKAFFAATAEAMKHPDNQALQEKAKELYAQLACNSNNTDYKGTVSEPPRHDE